MESWFPWWKTGLVTPAPGGPPTLICPAPGDLSHFPFLTEFPKFRRQSQLLRREFTQPPTLPVPPPVSALSEETGAS